jgi:hypothetical protein
MTARNSDRHREVLFGDRAMPNFVTSPALPDEGAAGRAQQIPQRTVELRRHSDTRRLGFAQRRDLHEQRCRIDVRMIVRQ